MRRSNAARLNLPPIGSQVEYTAKVRKTQERRLDESGTQGLDRDNDTDWHSMRDEGVIMAPVRVQGSRGYCWHPGDETNLERSGEGKRKDVHMAETSPHDFASRARGGGSEDEVVDPYTKRESEGVTSGKRATHRSTIPYLRIATRWSWWASAAAGGTCGGCGFEARLGRGE
jgi:hypothetical protein